MASAVPMTASALYTTTLTPVAIPRSFRLNLGMALFSLLLSGFGGVWFEDDRALLSFPGALIWFSKIREVSELPDFWSTKAIKKRCVGGDLSMNEPSACAFNNEWLIYFIKHRNVTQSSLDSHHPCLMLGFRVVFAISFQPDSRQTSDQRLSNSHHRRHTDKLNIKDMTLHLNAVPFGRTALLTPGLLCLENPSPATKYGLLCLESRI